MATEQQLRADYLRWIEAINSKDLDLMDRTTDELIARDYVWHHSVISDPQQGAEGVKRFVRRVLENTPDFRIAVEDLLVEGDKIASRWTIHRTHPETGKPQRMVNIQILCSVEGKLAEAWELIGEWEDEG
jgi:predicted ester cyclase